MSGVNTVIKNWSAVGIYTSSPHPTGPLWVYTPPPLTRMVRCRYIRPFDLRAETVFRVLRGRPSWTLTTAWPPPRPIPSGGGGASGGC
eukprot:8522430-Pyramimonas_sp.AAC.1